jgi:hypothetical protein
VQEGGKHLNTQTRTAVAVAAAAEAAAVVVVEENSRSPEPPEVARSVLICKRRFKGRDSNRCCNATPGDPHMRVSDAPNQLTLLLSHSLSS